MNLVGIFDTIIIQFPKLLLSNNFKEYAIGLICLTSHLKIYNIYIMDYIMDYIMNYGFIFYNLSLSNCFY